MRFAAIATAANTAMTVVRRRQRAANDFQNRLRGGWCLSFRTAAFSRLATGGFSKAAFTGGSSGFRVKLLAGLFMRVSLQPAPSECLNQASSSIISVLLFHL